MKKIVNLCDRNIIADHVSTMKSQRLKIPCNDWTNNFAAVIVVFAVINLTSQTFSALDTFSWYSLLIISVCCTIQQLNAETNLLPFFWDVQVCLAAFFTWFFHNN